MRQEKALKKWALCGTKDVATRTETRAHDGVLMCGYNNKYMNTHIEFPTGFRGEDLRHSQFIHVGA